MVELAVETRISKLPACHREQHRMRIEFKNGAIRVFSGVAAKIVGAPAKAKSPGSFYIDHIGANFERLLSGRRAQVSTWLRVQVHYRKLMFAAPVSTTPNLVLQNSCFAEIRFRSQSSEWFV